jgi:hypothetical protein
MVQTKFQSHRRWYDQEAGSRDLLATLQHIEQPDILDFACNLLIQVADEVEHAILTRNGSAPKTLGLAGIKEKYLGKMQTKRWYDQKPNLKKAVSRFYTLPLNGLAAVCFKLEEPFGLLALYSYMCQSIGLTPREDDLTQIARLSLFETRVKAEAMMSQLVGDELYEALVAEYQAEQLPVP